MKAKEIRLALMKNIINYHIHYNLSLTRSINETVLEVFNGIQACSESKKNILRSYETMRDMIYSIIEGKPFKIRGYERDWFVLWINYPVGNYREPTFTESKAILKSLKAYKQELKDITERTAKDREHLKYYGSITVADRIHDFIRYYTEVTTRDFLFLYTDLYQLGYIDGKRAERKRRAVK